MKTNIILEKYKMPNTFNFDTNYTLENEIVRLTPLTKENFQNLLPFSLNEPEIWTYSQVQAIGEEGLKNYLSLATKARTEKREYPFIVFDKRTNVFAGTTRFYDIQLPNNCLQLGYTWYGKSFQGTGINKHCKYLLLQFAFEQMGIERVEFRADNDNARSIAAMKSIGCTVEGVLRSNGIRPDGSRRDSIVLSILKTEWKNKIKTELENKLV
jgi:RimJ/RimL family protein N-acetyltransferase